MELKEFKQHIESFPQGTEFEYGVSKPFSWRGVYAEVAFEMLEQPMKREEILANIELAYTETFNGYKGGEYRYNDHTDIHFEADYGSYTDGGYVSRWIAKIEEKEEYQSQEARLVKVAFS
jgi:hypothetical protein